ncbi:MULTISPECIES: alpha-amylase family glycosyl hydrolase [unclassified Treponema]|uniref:alpha-amylase family glycosyl hydrolase n=1 Tax=unclassified Treponema TaxID=2638727 RepID=UPI0020A2A9F4|nr:MULTISPECIES: alpha-amylase family glycosyl hydrolase [unclassified Treponema]UTC67146.1 alpha-amylase [Treponema sp. OMZ 789]UTC69876.1 alpha-amylase [Treponema sp. OMZ 790]UTC72591.1 alpha-amylase [Treponema sp. OMZ 791]
MAVNSFFQKMEFHINGDVRKKCNLKSVLFSSCGNAVFENISEVHNFVFNFNSCIKEGIFGKNQKYLQAGELNAMGIFDEVLHYVLRLYRQNIDDDFFVKGYEFIDKEFKNRNFHGLDFLLKEFCKNFPPRNVYTDKLSLDKWLESNDEASNVPNKLLALEELILLCLANRNPANAQFAVLFNDINLKTIDSYKLFWETAKKWSKKNKPIGSKLGNGQNEMDILSFLEEPVKRCPYSIFGQLNYVKEHWAGFTQNLLLKVLGAEDLIREEEKAGWGPPQGGGFDVPVYTFENLLKEYEAFTPDKNWMPNLVLIAKSTLVWLDQLSKKYSAPITRLDQIPDEELRFFADAGITGLWLIGVWQRSEASRRIKEICGNPDAAASAYSIYDYDIAEELGGWPALANLRERAREFGIRMAADMVPNHTGLDSKWIMEDPNLFLQTRESPFPAYNYDTENLSRDGRTSVYLEKGYYSKTDCAVVFKRVDNYTGDVRYIYHGNDGTGLPWNDTAQIDFLNSEAREKVIQKILHVARNFPIIRFDAAMVLAKKHIRRLWYPAPGSGGDIASRSCYALSIEEFEKRIPEEFWREVVDRCAKEAPDTLLLAEAFWMMEGYFVRTLGMHRVYNSAFMNMLKKEENAKYRETIKNTLEFDPEVLRRYVNFMNNPDEETAIAQFGDGDKYFGICTMMSAMPGLPMFGHGQLEGFTEKYGMEYRRAYKDETVNRGLLERHKKEIFPLLKRRHIFSGVEKFRLFDFWNEGNVNENVFVWSNFFDGERSLIFYNNAYERASGWIKLSAAFALKNAKNEKELRQETLMTSLNLSSGEAYFTVFYEQRSSLFFLRKNSELAEKGFFAALDGYQCQVFLSIYEVKDEEGYYSELYQKTDGRGFKDIDFEINKCKYGKLYECFKDLSIKDYFPQILEYYDACKNKKTAVENISKKLCPSIQEFFDSFNAEFVKIFPHDENKPHFSLFKNSIARFFNILYLCADDTYPAEKEFKIQGFDLFVNDLKALAFGTKENALLYAAGLLLSALFKFFPEEKIRLCRFDFVLAEQLCSFGLSESNATSSLFLLNRLFYFTENKSSSFQNQEFGRERLKVFIDFCAHDEAVKKYLGLNEWDGEVWFNKESVERLILIDILYKFVWENSEDSFDFLSLKPYVNAYSAMTEALFDAEYRLKNIIDFSDKQN